MFSILTVFLWSFEDTICVICILLWSLLCQYQQVLFVGHIYRELPPHPNIVQMFGISLHGRQPIIVLEYCSGGNLSLVSVVFFHYLSFFGCSVMCVWHNVDWIDELKPNDSN